MRGGIGGGGGVQDQRYLPGDSRFQMHRVPRRLVTVISADVNLNSLTIEERETKNDEGKAGIDTTIRGTVGGVSLPHAALPHALPVIPFDRVGRHAFPLAQVSPLLASSRPSSSSSASLSKKGQRRTKDPLDEGRDALWVLANSICLDIAVRGGSVHGEKRRGEERRGEKRREKERRGEKNRYHRRKRFCVSREIVLRW